MVKQAKNKKFQIIIIALLVIFNIFNIFSQLSMVYAYSSESMSPQGEILHSRTSDNGKYLIKMTRRYYSHQNSNPTPHYYLCALDLSGRLIDKHELSYDGRANSPTNLHFYQLSGKNQGCQTFSHWGDFDNDDEDTTTTTTTTVPSAPQIITQTVYIKPDYSSIKSTFDLVINNQIATANNLALGLKDYRLGFSYSDYELRIFIQNANYSDLMTRFNSYYNGINLSYMPLPSSTYRTSIDSDNAMTSYMNSVGNNCASQISYLNTYGKAFINSYNNKYCYMQSMKTTDLKRFLAYCINSDSSTLDKCIYIYKDLVGVHSKIYLPSNYVNTAFREYTHYSDNTWYSLQDGQLELLECIQYNLPSNVGDLSIK